MKKTILLCSLAAIVAFVAGLKVGQPNDFQTTNYNNLKHQIELIKAYSAYSESAESLLDTLDSRYDWVDSFDPYAYYESRAKLVSLLQDAN